MAQWLKVLVGLTEAPSSVLDTHAGDLTHTSGFLWNEYTHIEHINNNKVLKTMDWEVEVEDYRILKVRQCFIVNSRSA